MVANCLSGKVRLLARIATLAFATFFAGGSCQIVANARAGSADDKYFDSGGVKIRYISLGAGEPVILIHGWAADAEMWDVAIQNLSRNYQVVAFDCRGHGKSGKPTDPSKYGMEMLNDVVRLMDHLGIAKAHILG